jgi:exodeoxyribonuclease VII small subunit
MQRLQDLLAKMQAPEASLADSLQSYAEAAQLIAYCQKTLDEASLKIEEIDSKIEASLADSRGSENDDGKL